jgi:hypothetical protein
VDVDEVCDELYALPLEQFTLARNARAKELAASGDREAAGVVRKLPKPSGAAWSANMLVRGHRDDVEHLLALGEDLRRAQDAGAGEDLRRLSTRRQALVQRLVTLASDEAARAGLPFSDQLQSQLRETLEAAVADRSAAGQLRGGRLTEPLSHIGFGGLGALERGSRVPAPPVAPVPRKGVVDQERLAAARVSVVRARTALEASMAALNEARRRHDAAGDRKRRAAAELWDAERELTRSSAAMKAADERSRRDDRTVKQSERELERREAKTSDQS